MSKIRPKIFENSRNFYQNSVFRQIDLLSLPQRCQKNPDKCQLLENVLYWIFEPETFHRFSCKTGMMDGPIANQNLLPKIFPASQISERFLSLLVNVTNGIVLADDMLIKTRLNWLDIVHQ